MTKHASRLMIILSLSLLACSAWLNIPRVAHGQEKAEDLAKQVKQLSDTVEAQKKEIDSLKASYPRFVAEVRTNDQNIKNLLATQDQKQTEITKAIGKIEGLLNHQSAAIRAEDSELKVLTVEDCSQEPLLKSLNGYVPTLIRFTNATSQPIVVYWLNYQGKRDPSEDQKETLQPGQWGQRFTYLTHPFLVTDASGKCLGIYQPTREPSLAIIK